MAAMTFAQNVLSRASGKEVCTGEIVQAKVDLAMSHENAALVLGSFREIGAQKIWDPSRVVLLFDHRIPANTLKTAESHKEVRNFARSQDLPHFYDLREGICHQVLPEKGHVRPGMLIVGSDSHTTTYGALGAFSTGIGATEMAAVWATGEIWMRVPETMRICIQGKLGPHIRSKDVILHIIGRLGADGADYKCVEFVGDTVNHMSIASRMVLSNMSIEMGAKAGVCFPDNTTSEWLAGRAPDWDKDAWLHHGVDAEPDERVEINVGDLVPQVACPHQVDNVCDVTKVEGTRVDQAVLGSCTNGRLEDLAAAEALLRGQKVHRDVRFIVVPASREIYIEAAERGILASLASSGAIIVNPGCGPCLGGHQGILAAGERCISTTNRNFKGRMGSPNAEVFLASPDTVAASAIRGEITDPRRV
ncbi:MAG: 3-isopropylmalate dehydratase large subunit [Euryarchaeota archaeon]|nr:3-isopropylmalate dehydratase large subunit [Euryarchaeota archaeon]